MNFKLKFFNLDWPSFMADQPDKYMPLHIKRWWDRGLQPARLPSTWCWLFVYAHLQRTLETLKKLYPKSMRHPPSLSATVIKEMEEISNTWQALLRFEGKHEAWENFHDMHNVRELKQHRFNGFLVKRVDLRILVYFGLTISWTSYRDDWNWLRNIHSDMIENRGRLKNREALLLQRTPIPYQAEYFEKAWA